MPELPEIETAARLLRQRVLQKPFARVRVLHPSLGRSWPASSLRSLRGAVVTRVDRRGKHQLLVLQDGRILHVHFRMTGGWVLDAVGADLPRFARAAIDFEDGTRLVLDDARALSTVRLYPASHPPDLGIGPDANDPRLDAAALRVLLGRRRQPIKAALLDQAVIAGLGNIYAAEALWRARLDPRRAARDLTSSQLTRLVAAIRAVLARATGARYRAGLARFEVYDRLGAPCRRCAGPIHRIVQAGRSTYFCPQCQTMPAARQSVASRRAALR